MPNISESLLEQGQVIEQFLEWYGENQKGYVSIAEESARRLTQVLGDAGVPHKVDYRAKDMARLKMKVDGRKAGCKYERTGDIIADIVDLAGVRVIVYFPSDKDRIAKFVNENFDIHSNAKFRGTEIQGHGKGSHLYVPKYPKYCADHYRATLKLAEGKERKPWHDLRVEIQVTTILRHAWAEVEHDWNYKQLIPGGDDEFNYQLLDALSGALDMGEFFMDGMQKRLATQRADGDKPFGSQYGLGSFLMEWAKENGRHQDLTDVQTLWEVLDRFNYDKRTRLLKILDGLDLSPELARKYDPLPLNPETAIIHSIMVSDERYKRQDKIDAENRPKWQKYKLKVVRDCFIWFGRLFRFDHKWLSLLYFGNDPKRVIANMEWLVDQSRKEGEPLSSGDEKILDDLFDTFASHERLAVQYVFFLARFRVKIFQADGFAMRKVVQPLLALRAHQQRRLY